MGGNSTAGTDAGGIGFSSTGGAGFGGGVGGHGVLVTGGGAPAAAAGDGLHIQGGTATGSGRGGDGVHSLGGVSASGGPANGMSLVKEAGTRQDDKDLDADETDIASLGISFDFVTYPSDGPVILLWNGAQGAGSPIWWATVFTEAGGTPSNSAEVVRVDKLRNFATDTPT